MSTRTSHLRSLTKVALALGFLAAAIPAAAYTPVYLWDVNQCRTDEQLFLNLAVRDSGVSRTTLEPVLPRVQNLSADLPVVLFLSRHSGRPVAAIVDLRARGLSWIDVFRQLGIGYDTLFLDLDRDPGPPYRSAWTYWRTNPSAPRLTDYHVRDLVQLQYVRRLTGVPVNEVVQTRARGRSPIVLVAEKHRRTLAAAGVPPGHGGVPPGHGGVPPGRVKSDTPPGHRGVVKARAPGKTKVHAQKVKVKAGPRGTGKGVGKGGGKGQGVAQGKGRGRGGR